MLKFIEEVREITFLNEDDSIKLMLYFKWNLELLNSQYFQSDKITQEIQIKAGIITQEAVKANNNPETHYCQICYQQLDKSVFIGLKCGHKFCENCWKSYLKVSVESGNLRMVFFKCPEQECNIIIDNSLFKKFLTKGEFSRYRHFLLKNYTDDCKAIKWCPQKGCENFAMNPSLIKIPIFCKCGNVFCFGCGESWHDPMTCEITRQWKDKNTGEEENAKWILVNTKICPGCHKHIEKNQGCNHMTCKLCKHEFCWICMGKWSEHGEKTGGYYKCQIYLDNPDKFNTQKTKEEEIKHELEKYLFHYERYALHLKSMKYAKEKLTSRIQEYMGQLAGIMGYPALELVCFNKAIEVIIEARQVIANSYGYAYYLTDQIEKNLLNFLKENLELKCEDLQHLLEQPFEKFLNIDDLDRKPFYNFKADITGLASATEHYYKNFIDGCKEGLKGCNH